MRALPTVYKTLAFVSGGKATPRVSPRALRLFASPTVQSDHDASVASSLTPFLDQARRLQMPSREAMLHRDPSVEQFWYSSHGALEKAWKEWAQTEDGLSLPALDASLYHPKLRKAIKDAWKDPSKEDAIRDLWEGVAPGVYQCQFFDPEKIREIRTYLDKAAEAGIPTRPPHGIVLNRKGFMLDPRSSGYMGIPAFQTFYRDLVDTYMRPLGRLFFPEYIQADDDTETFAFSIQYQAGKDQSIREHSDASSLTLNININLPGGDDYSGSSLSFVDPATGQRNLVNFAPGVAVMHRGRTMHAALPITGGERSNLVLWLYGEGGHTTAYPYKPEEQMTAEERWTKPGEEQEGRPLWNRWSPF